MKKIILIYLSIVFSIIIDISICLFVEGKKNYSEILFMRLFGLILIIDYGGHLGWRKSCWSAIQPYSIVDDIILYSIQTMILKTCQFSEV